MSRTTRPLGRTDADYQLDITSFKDTTFRGEYDANDNLIYAGFARPGASEAEEVWQIFEMTYDANDNLEEILWPQDANGQPSSDYAFAWADRAMLTFS